MDHEPLEITRCLIPPDRMAKHMDAILEAYHHGVHLHPANPTQFRAMLDALADAWRDDQDCALRALKPRITAENLREHRARVQDMIDKLEGRGKWVGDMGNPCYGDGYYANAILRLTGCRSITQVKAWLRKTGRAKTNKQPKRGT